MDWQILLSHVISGAVFTIIGLIAFGLSLWLFVKISPFSVRKEIEEDQNVALGVIMGAMLIGIAMIISAAIQG